MRNVYHKAIAVAFAIAGVGMGAAQELESGPIRSQELSTVTYTIPNAGQVHIYLPSDIRAGDTITGTVVAVPSGKTDEEKNKNAAVLKGVVVTCGTSQARPTEYLKFAVPLIGATTIKLLDKNGNPIGSKPVPTNPGPPPPPQNNFSLPEIVQPGNPCEVPGPFDGNASGTSIKVGGQDAMVIAESQRAAVFMCPSDVPFGPQQIQVSDAGKSADGECHAASVMLKAQQTMQLGQTTPLNVEIRGLEGFDHPVYLRIENHTPGVVKMNAGGAANAGNAAHFELQPFGPEETMRSLALISLLATRIGEFEISCRLAAGLCGATTHELFITGPSKRNDSKGYHVEWKEVCYLGTCYLKKGHAGDHAYSWAKCKDHAEIPHKETFKSKEDRDARYREVEKDRDKRKAAHDFGG